jgi:hypothetical protein
MKYLYELDCECYVLYDRNENFVAYVPCWRHQQDSTVQEGAQHEYAQ